MDGDWYVVRIEPRMECRVADALTKEGMEIWLPLINGSRSDQRPISMPLFPGYLFIKRHWAFDEWPIFNTGHRVLGWLQFGDIVPSITNYDMNELINCVDAMNAANGLWYRFKVGEQVRITSGNFQGMAEVIIEAKSPADRALVLTQFMGRLVQAQVPWVDLQPAPDRIMMDAHNIEKIRVPRRTRGGGRLIREYTLSGLS